MNKYGIVITILAALLVGAIVYICCDKFNKSEKCDCTGCCNCKPEEDDSMVLDTSVVFIGSSKFGDANIEMLFDKEMFLKYLDADLNKSEKRYEIEDVKLWNELNYDGTYTPILSISYFDIKEEIGITDFIQPTKFQGNGKMLYAVGNGSRILRCGGTCNNPCVEIRDEKGDIVFCQPCTDPRPYFDFGDIEGRRKWEREHHCGPNETGGGNGGRGGLGIYLNDLRICTLEIK